MSLPQCSLWKDRENEIPEHYRPTNKHCCQPNKEKGMNKNDPDVNLCLYTYTTKTDRLRLRLRLRLSLFSLISMP